MKHLLFPALLLTAACQMTDTPTKPTEDACGAAELQVLIGMNAKEVDLSDQKGDVRIIGPDTAVTMDYVPTRLNVGTDANGVITSVTCG